MRYRERAADPPGVVLLHSPLIGPLCWQPLAERLPADGYRVIAPDLTSGVVSDRHQQSFIAAAVDAIGVAEMGSAVLVGHSGAGPLLPAIANATTTVGVIFVDAGLPHPGKSWFETAPPTLTAHLKSLVGDDGALPRWSDWFDPAVLNEAIADPQLRLRFIDELPRLSLDYFEQPTPATAWDGPTAYLQLSADYVADADRADAAGWPVQRLTEGHLAILTAPQHVLPSLIALLEAVR